MQQESSPPTKKNTLASDLREFRGLRKMSQEAAAAFFYADRTGYNRWENGHAHMTLTEERRPRYDEMMATLAAHRTAESAATPKP